MITIVRFRPGGMISRIQILNKLSRTAITIIIKRRKQKSYLNNSSLSAKVSRNYSHLSPYIPSGLKMNHFSGENPLDEECAQSWCCAKVQPWIAIRTHLFQPSFGYEHLQKYLDQRSYIIDLWQDCTYAQIIFVNIIK